MPFYCLIKLLQEQITNIKNSFNNPNFKQIFTNKMYNIYGRVIVMSFSLDISNAVFASTIRLCSYYYTYVILEPHKQARLCLVIYILKLLLSIECTCINNKVPNTSLKRHNPLLCI